MIFGLIGLKGSGKSTAAKMLCFLNIANENKYTYGWYKKHEPHIRNENIFAFGDNLKDFVAKMFNIPIDYFNNRELKESYFNPCTKSFKTYSKLRNGESLITLNRALSDIENNRFNFTLENLRNKSNFYIKLRTLLQIIGTEICKSTLGESIWIYPVINKVKSETFAVIEDIRFVEELDAVETLDYNFIIKLINTKYSRSDGHSSENDINSNNFQYEIIYNGGERDLFYKIVEIYKRVNNHAAI